MASIEYLKKYRFRGTFRLYGCNDFGCQDDTFAKMPGLCWSVLSWPTTSQAGGRGVGPLGGGGANGTLFSRCALLRQNISVTWSCRDFHPFLEEKQKQHEWFPCETSFFLWPFKWSPFFVAEVKSPVGDFVAPTSLRLSPTILWSKPLPSEPTTPLPVRRSAECAVGPGYASTPASGQVLDRMKQRKVYPNPITFNTAMNSEFWWCFLQIFLGIWFICICF